MRFANNDYVSFENKMDNNVQLVNAICLHYTPNATTFGHCEVSV